MKSKPIVMDHFSTVHTSYIINFDFTNNITILTGSSATGKTASFSFMRECMAMNPDIVCINYQDYQKDIKKLIALPLRDFKVAFPQLPIPTREAIITLFATQIENGTFEQLNKANYIDEVCGTRLDLKMH